MTEEHKERIYEEVRRMVIWDEPRADVFHRLEVNGIPVAEAQQMHDKAHAERMAMIRSDAIRKTALGTGLLLVASALLFGLAAGMRAVIWPVLALGGTAAVFGLWYFSKGLFYLFFAHSKSGSLADAD